MMRDYEVRTKDGKLVGVVRAPNEGLAILEAWKKTGGASKYSGTTLQDYVAIKLGIL